MLEGYRQYNIKKIHGVIALTATAPLLNLNLNYEKLRNKVKNNKTNYQPLSHEFLHI